MAVCRAQVIFPDVANAAENTVVNNWGFELSDPTENGISLAQASLQIFYGAIGPIFSNLQLWSANVVKWYRMSDPKPRVPFATSSMPIGFTGNTLKTVPEAAICLSFQADEVSGVNQARRRGRIYLGPLAYTCIDSTDGNFTSATVDFVHAAAAEFLGNSGGTNWDWCVVSETGGLDGPIITNGWVDNEIDIQRRRGRIGNYSREFGTGGGLRRWKTFDRRSAERLKDEEGSST